jgi:Ca2+-binding RTX toxin-like protein
VRVNLTLATAQSTVSAGSDTLAGIENLTGGAYDDQLTGDAGTNILTGNAGNDLLNGGLGNDTLNGGAGIDTASYATATSGVTINLALTTAQDTHGAGIDTFLSIENLTGSAYDDIITGSAQANIIFGGNGNDIIDAGSSNDNVDGGYGNDILKGAGGDDILIGGVGTDTLTGGAGADTLTGGTQNDSFVFTTLTDSAPATADRITDLASGDKVDVSAIDANSTLGGNQAFHIASAFTHSAGEYTLAYDAGTNTTTALFDTDGDATANMAILFTGDVTALTSAWLL